MSIRKRLLILGGTAEAQALAKRALATGRFDVMVSLAGRTREPAEVAGELHVGGFGGARGFARYLLERKFKLLVDATHPFAAQMSANAAEASAETGVPRLILVRPHWEPEPGDNWIMVPDMAAAAEAVGRLGRRVFLTVGRQELAAFAELADIHFVVRLIEAPEAPVPLPDHELLLGRAPFTLRGESALMRQHGIDLLVSKNSGGDATYAKIDAARRLKIPVVMVERPAPPPGPVATDVDAAMAWITEQIA